MRSIFFIAIVFFASLGFTAEIVEGIGFEEPDFVSEEPSLVDFRPTDLIQDRDEKKRCVKNMNAHSKQAPNNFYPSPENLSPQLKQAWQTAVQIEKEEGKNQISSGSGVVLGVKGDSVYYATAAHLIPSWCRAGKRCKGLSVNHGVVFRDSIGNYDNLRDDGYRATKVSVVEHNRTEDFIILKVTHPEVAEKARSNVAKVASACPRRGDYLTAIGFPNKDAVYKRKKRYRLERTTSRRRKIEEVQQKFWLKGQHAGIHPNTIPARREPGCDSLFTINSRHMSHRDSSSLAIVEGNSGGPVFNDRGELTNLSLGGFHDARSDRGGVVYRGERHAQLTRCDLVLKVFQK